VSGTISGYHNLPVRTADVTQRTVRYMTVNWQYNGLQDVLPAQHLLATQLALPGDDHQPGDSPSDVSYIFLYAQLNNYHHFQAETFLGHQINVNST
jgi:hypothetical protein